MTVASTKEIKDFTEATSLADTDVLAASVSNRTRKVKLSTLRAQLLNGTHTHAIGDVTGLQAALDAIDSKLDDARSVKDFGVASDQPTVDQTALLQSAIDSGVPLYAPPGTYLHSGLLFPAGQRIRLFGAGRNHTTFKLANGSNTHSFECRGFFDFSGFTIDGNRANQSVAGDGIYANNTSSGYRNSAHDLYILETLGNGISHYAGSENNWTRIAVWHASGHGIVENGYDSSWHQIRVGDVGLDGFVLPVTSGNIIVTNLKSWYSGTLDKTTYGRGIVIGGQGHSLSAIEVQNSSNIAVVFQDTYRTNVSSLAIEYPVNSYNTGNTIPGMKFVGARWITVSGFYIFDRVVTPANLTYGISFAKSGSIASGYISLTGSVSNQMPGYSILTVEGSQTYDNISAKINGKELLAYPQDFAGIQTLITAASAAGGGVIELQPELVYVQNASINVPANVSIKGNGATIQRSNFGYNIVLLGDNTIEDVVFDGNATGLGTPPLNPTNYCDLKVKGPRVVIKNNHFKNLTGSAIGNNLDTDQDVNDLWIVDNLIEDYKDNGISIALDMADTGVPTPRNIKITGNTFRQNPGVITSGGTNYAIRFREAANEVMISRNNFDGVATALALLVTSASQSNSRAISNITLQDNDGVTTGAMLAQSNATTGARDARFSGVSVVDNRFTCSTSGGAALIAGGLTRASFKDLKLVDNKLYNYTSVSIIGDANFTADYNEINGNRIDIPSSVTLASSIFYFKLFKGSLSGNTIISTAASVAGKYLLYTDDDTELEMIGNHVEFLGPGVISLANKARIKLYIKGGSYIGHSAWFFDSPVPTGDSRIRIGGDIHVQGIGNYDGLYNESASNVDHGKFLIGTHVVDNQQWDGANLSTTTPTLGTYEKGTRIWQRYPTSGASMGVICTTSGTARTIAGITADTTSGSPTTTFNDASGLLPGDYVNVAGAITAGRIKSISGNTVVFYSNASATVSAGAVTVVSPVFKSMGNLA